MVANTYAVNAIFLAQEDAGFLERLANGGEREAACPRGRAA